MDDQNQKTKDQDEVTDQTDAAGSDDQTQAGNSPANPVEPTIEEKQAEVEAEDVEEKIEPETETPNAPTTQEPNSPEEVPSLTESQEQHDQRLAEEANLKDTPDEAAPKVSSVDPNDPSRWYIVHTYSGHENKVAKSIHQRVQSLGFENRIFEVIVPTRNTIKVSGGKKETVKEKIFPGYVLVKMVLDDESWLLIRTTQGVTAFIGAGNKPTPISDKEVEAIQKFMNEEEPLYKASFSVGEAVKIVDGPFADFLGTIDNIDEARGKLKVLVSIFGRETPVELDFLQVNKL